MITLSKVKNVTANGSFENQYGTPDENGKKLLYKFEYEMEDGTIINANHKYKDGNFEVGSSVEYEVKKDDPEYGKSGKVTKPGAGNFSNKPSGGSKVDSNVQAMIVKQNALGHATELLKHNAIMDNSKFLSKDVMALAQIYADWVMSTPQPEKVQEVVQSAKEALMNDE